MCGQLNLVGAFRWRASEEPEYCYVDLLQPRILCLDDILGGLKAGQDRLIFEDDVSGAQLFFCIEKDLRLEYPGEIWLINKVEIGGCEILVYKNPKNKSIVREGICQAKKNISPNYNKRKKRL